MSKLRRLFVAAAAGYRAARFLQTDSITENLRVAVELRSIDGRRTDTELRKWELLHQLLSCPFCLGFWTTVAAYMALRAGRRHRLLTVIVEAWAAAGINWWMVDQTVNRADN